LVVIGWDKDKESGNEYWIVRNTWGSDWGINGYAHIAIGQKQLFLEDFAIAITPRVEKSLEQEEKLKDSTNVGGQGKKEEHVDLDK